MAKKAKKGGTQAKKGAKIAPKETRARGFRSTRAAHADETAEDYVEAVADIIADRGECRVRDLAPMMGVSHVTVVRTIERLSKQGLVETEPYRPIALTAKGRRLARKSRERHEVVLRFLLEIGVPQRQAQIDAEGIEHHVSDATVRAMRRLADRMSSEGAGG